MSKNEHFKQKTIDDTLAPPNQIGFEQGMESKKGSR